MIRRKNSNYNEDTGQSKITIISVSISNADAPF